MRASSTASTRRSGARDVYVYRGRIVRTSRPDAGRAARTTSSTRGGRVLLPGLFDMHAHIGSGTAGCHLAAGVTTVRDMGNDNATLQQIMAQEAAGTLLAPHIVPAGFIEGESPNAARNGFVIKNLVEAKQAVDWYARARLSADQDLQLVSEGDPRRGRRTTLTPRACA